MLIYPLLGLTILWWPSTRMDVDLLDPIIRSLVWKSPYLFFCFFCVGIHQTLRTFTHWKTQQGFCYRKPIIAGFILTKVATVAVWPCSTLVGLIFFDVGLLFRFWKQSRLLLYVTTVSDMVDNFWNDFFPCGVGGGEAWRVRGGGGVKREEESLWLCSAGKKGFELSYKWWLVQLNLPAN